MSTTCLAVIPARFDSLRCPGKPLANIEGKTMLRRVWEQVSKTKGITEIVIAADDPKVVVHSKGFPANAVLTSERHPSWIERAMEVVFNYSKEGKQFDVIAVVPCDLPFVKPELIEGTIKSLIEAAPSFEIATAAAPIYTEEDFNRMSVVKVVMGHNGRALYFSHSPVPHIKNKEELKSTVESVFGDRHIDIFACRPSAFSKVAAGVHTAAEKREELDVLRFLSHGVQMKVFLAALELVDPCISVDTQEDLRKAVNYARTHLSQNHSIPTW